MTTKATPPADFFGPLQQEMSKTLSSANESVLQAMQSVENAKATARQTIAKIDTDIREMSDAHTKLVVGSVNAKEVASHLAAQIRNTIKRERELLMFKAAAAKSLSAHKSIKAGGVMIADGRFVFTEKDVNRVSFYDCLKDGLGVFALLVDDDEIDALAAKLAKKIGAKEDGPTVDELQTQANALVDQIEAMQNQRFELKAQLEKFIDIKLSPFANTGEREKFEQSMRALPPTPTITHKDSTGINVIQTGLAN